MCILEKNIIKFREATEQCIVKSGYINKDGLFKKSNNGHEALGSFIRSQIPIGYIHEAIKEVFVKTYKIDENRIYPPLGKSKPELKVVGKLKEKDQDICIVPNNIDKTSSSVSTYMGIKQDKLGISYLKHTLILNVRSQIVSIAKNTDTILERTFAEPVNLNLRNDEIILGEFFLLPISEINISCARNNQKGYKNISNYIIEKYINFFTAIRDKENKTQNEKIVSYSECCLILVDLSRNNPKIYKTTQELIDDGFVSDGFDKEINQLYFYNVIKNLYDKYLNIYSGD